MYLFERDKSIKVKQLDQTKCEITASFKDKFHHIKTTVVVDSQSQRITAASAEMCTVPFDLCHEVCSKMNELVGLKIGRGVTKWVKEIIGSSRGCAHLFDLVLDSLKVIKQATEFCMLPDELPFDEKLQKIQATNIGICHTYSNLSRHPKYIGNKDI